MFWIKRCPRCSGDLFGDRDQYGLFVTCIQCGFSKDATILPEQRGSDYCGAIRARSDDTAPRHYIHVESDRIIRYVTGLRHGAAPHAVRP